MIDDLSPWSRLPLVKLVVNSYLVDQEVYCVLQNQKVQYCVHMSLPLDHIMNHINAVKTFMPDSLSMHLILYL